MRRFVEPAHVLAFVAFFACVMAAGLVLKDFAIRASVQEVRAAVQRGPAYDRSTAFHTELDGTALPQWEPQGWRLTGGRTDLLEDNRDAVTGFYRRGESTIAYTLVDGSVEANGGDPTTGLSVPLRQVLSVQREVDGHTVVLTGWPVSDELLREMQDLAARVDA